MAEAPDKDQQTEAPTAKRKADAIREGDVFQSKELSAGLMMLAGLLWLMFAGKWFVDAGAKLLSIGLVLEPTDIDHFEPTAKLAVLLGEVALPLGSLLAICVMAAVAGPAILGSAGFRSKAMAPKGSRINPLAGLKRIFGVQGLVELVKSIAKVLVLGGAGYWAIKSHLPDAIGLAATHPAAAAAKFGQMLIWCIAALVGGMMLIAMLDIPAQYFQRLARLRMTKHQFKEEMRQTEGSPELKQAQRARQHEMLTGSARTAVTEASVILTNPTHFAIALRYRPGIDAAPVVVAKGRGETALAIRALAKEHHVPSLEYPQLARAIYFTSRTGRVVPEDLFVAVAAILAFVFRLDQAMASELTPPPVEVPVTKRFDADGNRAA
ncbi:flagellar biosynthesis protein FlhB [Nostoc sp. HG1]|nr:flagellar biosynthesis protein FlhB [Nostoc sp. HG1]